MRAKAHRASDILDGERVGRDVRSTVTFDYRIVATALGGSGQHMAILSPAAARALAPFVPRPVVPAPKIPARPPTPAVEPATP